MPRPRPHSICVSQHHTGQVHLPGPFSPASRTGSLLVSLYFDDTQPLHMCLSQGPRHRHPCAVPRVRFAWEMRPWQVGSGGDSAPGSLGGEVLSHSVQGTPQGSGSVSAGQAPWGHPVPTAKVRHRVPEYEPPLIRWTFGEKIHSC